MLYITDSSGAKAGWHVGEPMPWRVLRARVVTFQADCDELELIIRAMEQTHNKKMEGRG